MLRNILSVIAGYAIFVVTSLLLFKVSGKDPHADPTTLFFVLTLGYGMLFSFLSGLLTKLIANTKSLQMNYILAIIIAGFATFSFFKTEGNHWTQLLAIFVFAPVSVLGGVYKMRRSKN